MGNSIVFVDWRVADIDSLLAGMPADAEAVLLDGAFDGLDQIAGRLQGRSGIDAIHIISHGSSGSVSLGSGVIDSAALATHAGQLDTIGQSLTESDDILLYGCNFAAGDEGVQFIGSLAQLTGADVAASADITGMSTLGGNWVLEWSSGRIETQGLNLGGDPAVLDGAVVEVRRPARRNALGTPRGRSMPRWPTPLTAMPTADKVALS